MQIFRKKLTPVDIERGLVLPPDSNLELLPPFQGTMELPTIIESASGTPLAEPVTIHCSTRSGRPAFTTGWYEIARYVGLTGGDIVSFYQEFSEGAQYRMRVRSAVDVEERIDIAESSNGDELVEQEGDGMIVEPHDGMEFESEGVAKMFRN
uniref:TF-B3 domain-containing protein n=1 Tax=Salix viminalis TaxID=40686 RepID=A0A6N2MFN3_SALVM